LQNLPEHRVGDPLDLAVRFSPKLPVFEAPEIFQDDGCAMLLGEDNDPVRFLVASRLVEAPLVTPEFPENAPRPP
jgi:hypothetical protein